MADNTCLNALEAAIQRLNATMKTFMEKEDVRYAEYKMLRTTNALRLDRIEEKLVALKVSSASNGDLDSFLQSPENQSLVILPRMTDQPKEEIDASDLLDVEVLTTPYTTTEMSTLSEVLSETLLVVDASNLSSDRVIEPSISNFYAVSTIKGFIPSIVGHDCYSKEKTTTEVDSKRPGSLPVIVRRNFSPVVMLSLHLVFILPPPLAPPWLHHSLYTIPLNSLTSTKVNNLIHYLQFKQKILIGTLYHNTPIIDPQIPSVCVLTCSSYAYKNTVSLIDAHHLFVKIPLRVDFSFDTFTSLLSMMQIHAFVRQVDMDTSLNITSSILFHNDCGNCYSSSGLVFDFGVGLSSFPYDLYVNFACNSRGMIVHRNVGCFDFVSLFYCCHIEPLLVLSSSHDQIKLKGWNLLPFLVVERIGQVKLMKLLSFHHFSMFNGIVVHNFTLNRSLDCTAMPLHHSFNDSSGNHNAYSSYKHMDFSGNTKLSLYLHVHTSIMSLVNGIGENTLLSQSLESLVHDFIDMSLECKELFYDYFIGFALEHSGISLVLDKLVNYVPQTYPMDEDPIELCSASQVHMLGLGEYFVGEIEALLSQIYRNYHKDPNSVVRALNMKELQFQKDALAFELMWTCRFQVSSLWFCWFLNHEEIKANIEGHSKDVSSAMLGVFRASNLMFYGEHELEEAGIFSMKLLGLDKLVNNVDEVCDPVSTGFIKLEQLSDWNVFNKITVNSIAFSMHYWSLASSGRIDVIMTSSKKFTVSKKTAHQPPGLEATHSRISKDVNIFNYGDNIYKIWRTDRSPEVHKRRNGDLLFVLEQTCYMRSETEKFGDKNWNYWGHILKRFSGSTKQMLSKLFDKLILRLIVMLEDVLQQLQKLAPEPYLVHCLSYMHALSHDGDKKVADLISFSLVQQQFNQWDPGGY